MPANPASATAFASSLPFVLRWEGGFVDHPADRGGATNRGVTQTVYDQWRSRKGQPARPVRALEDAELRAIYEALYWQTARCDVLERPLALTQFDTAVNMGPGRAVRFLQAALGCTVDGNFGPGTLRETQACTVGPVVATYCEVRERFYRSIVANRPSQAVFMKGWMNRLNDLRAAAGVPGFARPRGILPEPDFGETGYIARVADDEDTPAEDLH